MKGFLREILATLVLAAVIFLLLQATIQSSVVVGSSMEPNLKDGQRLLINKVVYTFDEPQRGDVIVFNSPNNSQTDFIKRIIGLPSEAVEVKQGKVYIHKENSDVLPLDEPYIKEVPSSPFNGDIIAENEYFVLGDNRNNSNDSRNGWTVKRETIIGKAWLSIWPPDEWGLVSNYPLQEQLASPIHKQAILLAERTAWQWK